MLRYSPHPMYYVAVGWNVHHFLRQAHSPKLYIGLASVALVFTLVVVAFAAFMCPRSQRIVYIMDNDWSKTKQLPSMQETVPLIVDKFVSKHYRIDQQRYTLLVD